MYSCPMPGNRNESAAAAAGDRRLLAARTAGAGSSGGLGCDAERDFLATALVLSCPGYPSMTPGRGTSVPAAFDVFEGRAVTVEPRRLS
jgi:hypothetical protein